MMNIASSLYILFVLACSEGRDYGQVLEVSIINPVAKLYLCVSVRLSVCPVLRITITTYVSLCLSPLLSLSLSLFVCLFIDRLRIFSSQLLRLSLEVNYKSVENVKHY